MGTKHSNLGPSSAKRWMNCPGSVAATADAPPQPASIHAAEGTVAHGLAEMLVEGQITDHALMARVGDISEQEGFDIEITEEMVNAAIEYRDLIVSETALMNAEGKPAPVVGKAEVRVFVKSISRDLFGTADYILYQKGNKLKVFDFKYGKGVAVSPEKNEQAAIYALGAMDGEAGRAFDEVELIIVQPRAGGDTVKRWVASKTWLKQFYASLEAAVGATQEPNAPLAAGDWCRWCAAKATCPAIFEDVQKQAMVDFAAPAPVAPKVKKGETPVLPDISKLSLENMTAALDWEEHINSWFEAVKLHIRALLDAGQEVPGYKLVEGKSNRKYIDEAKVIEEFAPLLGEEALFEKKLLSPAKLEKVVGKGKLEHLTFKPEGNKAIARDTDPRPTARNSASVDFTPVAEELISKNEPSSDDLLNELLGVSASTLGKIWP